MKKLIKSLSAALTAVCGLLMTAVTVLSGQMPEQFSVVEGSCLHLDGAVSVQETIGSNGESAEVAALNAGSTYTANLKLFGLFPVKQVTVRVVEQEMVIPCGTPFGIKMFTDGVLVVGMSDVDTAAGAFNPARSAGIQTGRDVGGQSDDLPHPAG